MPKEYDDEIRRYLGCDSVLPSSLGRVGNWSILNRLGDGAMGAVYRAVDVRKNDSAAVKFCFADEPRFLREIELLKQIPPHPSVIGFKSAHILLDSSSNGLRCFAMEHAGGGSLANRLTTWGMLAPIECLLICRDVAQGLAHLHKNGVRHRDLKPQNVLLDDRHRAKLADFGLAVKVPTGNSQVLGTPQYNAPEVFNNPASVDQSADYFSLGATLHELLTGVKAFPSAADVIGGDVDPSCLSFIRLEFGDEIACLIRDLCEKNSSKRLTDPELLDKRLNELISRAAVQKYTIPSGWPIINPDHAFQLISLAENAEPLLRGKLTNRLGLFVGKNEVLHQLRLHCDVVDRLKLKLSLIIAQLIDVDEASAKRLALIKEEFDKELKEFENACVSESGPQNSKQMSQLPKDPTLATEFGQLLQELMLQTNQVALDVLLNGFTKGTATAIRIICGGLWCLLDEYCRKAHNLLHGCTDQFLAVVEVLERGKSTSVPSDVPPDGISAANKATDSAAAPSTDSTVIGE